VRFAYLVQQLAVAVFNLRRRREPNLKFDDIFKKGLDQLLEGLEYELTQIPPEEGLPQIPEKELSGIPKAARERMEVQVLRSLAVQIKNLTAWRNPRIHARVDFEHGIALYDWRTKNPLEMTASDCDQKSERAFQLAQKLDDSTGSLLRELKANETPPSEIQVLLMDTSD
jgi:hypothetical protein